MAKRKHGIGHLPLAEQVRMMLFSLFEPDEVKREYRFDEKRRWRLDFAIPEANGVPIKLGIEVHGSTFTKGRHVTGTGFSGDREKMNAAQLQGWLVLELETNSIRSGKALKQIEIARATRIVSMEK